MGKKSKKGGEKKGAAKKKKMLKKLLNWIIVTGLSRYFLFLFTFLSLSKFIGDLLLTNQKASESLMYFVLHLCNTILYITYITLCSITFEVHATQHLYICIQFL